jgi:hypothetical protein
MKLFCTYVTEQLKRFREGCEDLEDYPRSWWPSTAQNLKTVGKVHSVVAGDLYDPKTDKMINY